LVLAVASPAVASLLAHRWLQARAVPLPEPSHQRGTHLSAPRLGVTQGSDFGSSPRDVGSGRRWPGFLSAEVAARRYSTGPARPVGPAPSGSQRFPVTERARVAWTRLDSLNPYVPYEPDFLKPFEEEVVEINRLLKVLSKRSAGSGPR